MDDPELALAWANLKHVHELVGAAIADRIEAEADLGASDAYVLFRLANSTEGCLRMGELAARLDMAQSGITRVIDRLESRGLVTRESPREDRRTTYARLTPEGWEKFALVRPVFLETIRERLAGALSETELAELHAMLRKIVEAAGGCEEQPWSCAAESAIAELAGLAPSPSAAAPATSSRSRSSRRAGRLAPS